MANVMSRFWGILTLIFVGFIFLGVITHAGGFSKAAGTLFTGVTNLGSTLSGASTAGPNA
jgi:hypothetical protein